jgi:hypothetical protein
MQDQMSEPNIFQKLQRQMAFSSKGARSSKNISFFTSFFKAFFKQKN